jgi:hypothetical protein
MDIGPFASALNGYRTVHRAGLGSTMISRPRSLKSILFFLFCLILRHNNFHYLADLFKSSPSAKIPPGPHLTFQIHRYATPSTLPIPHLAT